MLLFFRFLLREFFLYLLLFFLSLLFLLTIIRGTLGLREVIELEIGLLGILKLYFLQALQLISFILPLSALLALLFSFQRLREERELLAFFSLGYGFKDFLKPFFFFVLLITLFTFFSHFYLLPTAKRIQKNYLMASYEKALTSAIPIKTPTPFSPELYLYVSDSKLENSVNYIRKVLIMENKASDIKGIYLAEEGYIDKKKGYLNLKGGWIFYLEKHKNIEVLQFDSYLVHFTPERLKKEEFYIKRGEMSFFELKNQLKTLSPNTSKYYRFASEYYQRIFYAFTVIPLLFLGFLLSFSLKSHSKVLLFLLGVAFYFLVYLSYNFLLSLSEAGKVSPALLHLIFFSFYTLLIISCYKVLSKRLGINY